jgi:hypothetical protein
VFAQARRLGYARYFLNSRRAIEDDHVPLLKLGVPAVDIIDLDYEPFNLYWHIRYDTVDKCTASLAMVARVILGTLTPLESNPLPDKEVLPHYPCFFAIPSDRRSFHDTPRRDTINHPKPSGLHRVWLGILLVLSARVSCSLPTLEHAIFNPSQCLACVPGPWSQPAVSRRTSGNLEQDCSPLQHGPRMRLPLRMHSGAALPDIPMLGVSNFGGG